MAEKKYYWLKLQKDFFKRHDIRIIESMPNGKDYILFYLKLLVESVSHEGFLRFSDTIPYNEEMLSTITNTNVDIVRCAMKVFQELQMIDVLEDETIFLTEVDKMIGSETKWAEKKRIYREEKRTLSLPCPTDVRQEIDIEKEIEIDKDIDIEKDKEKKNVSKDTLKEKFGEYQNVKLTSAEYDKLANDYGVDIRNEAITFLDAYIEEKGYKSKSHNLAIRRWVIDAAKNNGKHKVSNGIDWSKI